MLNKRKVLAVDCALVYENVLKPEVWKKKIFIKVENSIFLKFHAAFSKKVD